MARKRTASLGLSSHSDTDHFNHATTSNDEEFGEDDQERDEEEAQDSGDEFFAGPTRRVGFKPGGRRSSQSSASSGLGVDEDDEDAEEDGEGGGDGEDGEVGDEDGSDDEGDKVEDGRYESGLIVPTNFDAYFTHIAARSQTSTNVFTHLIPPLTQDEYTEAISKALPQLNALSDKYKPALLEEPIRSQVFRRFMFELREGFNILCYGYGSKRQVLNDFAKRFCSKDGNVVVVNGFQPDLNFRNVLQAVETNVPGVAERDIPPGSSSALENQAKRIYDFLWEDAHAKKSKVKDLYFVIHNIDAPALRTQKVKSCLALLALHPRIHIIASIDHINAPLLWSTTEASTRKPDLSSSSPPVNPARGFNWLYHDLTTLHPYDFELTFADRTSLSGAHGGPPKRKDGGMGGGGAGGAGGGTMFSETAALHILASVTQKAKKLFELMANKQLESIDAVGAAAEDGGDGVGDGQTKTGSSRQQQQQQQTVTAQQQMPELHGIGYDALFNMARDEFIATNDTALRSLLGEFRDHGLVMTATGGTTAGGAGAAGGGEVLWIPMRKERLRTQSYLREFQVPAGHSSIILQQPPPLNRSHQPKCYWLSYKNRQLRVAWGNLEVHADLDESTTINGAESGIPREFGFEWMLNTASWTTSELHEFLVFMGQGCVPITLPRIIDEYDWKLLFTGASGVIASFDVPNPGDSVQ
ncbi:ORC2-domain-containing protein [Pluteus cervinus]|uniref:ORC2-domain-containing protein n=1 Tax=Pluteus cervinus TaxID=181527 RepID=A0ACD3A3I5_9AGAR|nr:ORC2-domain-containing protein [Pluteus cervinus]